MRCMPLLVLEWSYKRALVDNILIRAEVFLSGSQTRAWLNSLQCEMCGSVSACMTAPWGTMGNNLTHRDNPLHTHSRCTYNTITQNPQDAKHIMSLKWYLLSSETTHYPLPAQCSHNPQSLTKYKPSLQHELQARPTWREKRYQSASHSFSVTAKQCRSDAVQKLFAKERKHNLICVRFLLCVS